MGLKVICLHRFVGRGYLLHTSSLFPQQEGKTHPSATEKIEDCGGRKEDLEGDCLRLFFSVAVQFIAGTRFLLAS